MFLIIRMTCRRNAQNASSFIPVKKEMYVAAFPANHYALNAVPNAAPCTAVTLLPYFVTDLKNHLTSVITVNRSEPVPMTSIFTVPIMPMTFIMRSRFLPVPVSIRLLNRWNNWINWFRLFSLKGSHYLIFTLPINILSIVPSVHCITTLIMDILLLSIWTSPAKYAIKKRRKTRKAPENTGYRENRTYHHFEKYLEEYPDTNVVELDVVEGAGGKSEKVLLTMLFRNCNLMLIFLLEADNRKNIREVFLWLYEQLGANLYHKLFPVILTDNGSSFKDPEIFERPGNTACLSRVFYCDPMSSWQKGKLEKNHEFIRYILPKGIGFAQLNQNKVTLIANHINSVARASLNGCTPFKLAQLLIDRKLLELCNLKDIPADQVILKPTLLKH